MTSLNGSAPASTPPANAHRGEVTLDLGGEAWTLRPTFDALAEIEGTLGEGLLPLARRVCQEEKLGFRDADAIIAAGARAAGRAVDRRELRRLLTEAGLVALAAPLSRFLLGACTGGRPAGPSTSSGGEDEAARPMAATAATTGPGSGSAS